MTMMNLIKRSFALFIALSMCIGMLQITALAAETGEDTEIVTWEVSDANGNAVEVTGTKDEDEWKGSFEDGNGGAVIVEGSKSEMEPETTGDDSSEAEGSSETTSTETTEETVTTVTVSKETDTDVKKGDSVLDKVVEGDKKEIENEGPKGVQIDEPTFTVSTGVTVWPDGKQETGTAALSPEKLKEMYPDEFKEDKNTTIEEIKDANGNVIGYKATTTTSNVIQTEMGGKVETGYFQRGEEKLEPSGAPKFEEGKQETVSAENPSESVKLPEGYEVGTSEVRDGEGNVVSRVTVEEEKNEAGEVIGYKVTTEELDENGEVASTKTENLSGKVETTVTRTEQTNTLTESKTTVTEITVEEKAEQTVTTKTETTETTVSLDPGENKVLTAGVQIADIKEDGLKKDNISEAKVEITQTTEKGDITLTAEVELNLQIKRVDKFDSDVLYVKVCDDKGELIGMGSVTIEKFSNHPTGIENPSFKLSLPMKSGQSSVTFHVSRTTQDGSNYEAAGLELTMKFDITELKPVVQKTESGKVEEQTDTLYYERHDSEAVTETTTTVTTIQKTTTVATETQSNQWSTETPDVDEDQKPEGGESQEPSNPEGGEGQEPSNPEGGESQNPSNPEGGENQNPSNPEDGENRNPSNPEGGNESPNPTNPDSGSVTTPSEDDEGDDEDDDDGGFAAPAAPGDVNTAEEIEELEVPLNEIPDDLELLDTEVPLAEKPEELELSDWALPMADVPETGDISIMWYAASLLSACGLMILRALQGKKGENS